MGLIMKIDPHLFEVKLELQGFDVMKSGIPQPDEIKKKLTNRLIEEMIKQDRVYFTSVLNPLTDSKEFIARIYVATKDEVKDYIKNGNRS